MDGMPGKMKKPRQFGERRKGTHMTNIQLNHVNSPVTHEKAGRDIQFDSDNTTTKCGTTLPTRILKSTLRPVSCPICQKAGN
jgi:hypothetical protein